MIDKAALEVFRSDQDNYVASYKNVFVQVRTGKVTRQVVDHIEALIRLLLARSMGQPVGAVLIIEETAELPDAETRSIQTAAFRANFRSPRAHAAYVVIGNGPKATLLRAFGRLLAAGQARLVVFGSTEHAAQWMSEKMASAVSVKELNEFLSMARREARSATSIGPASTGLAGQK